METKELIYQMLTESTGTHFLDSGGDNNRHWQRNQKKTIEDFENEEAETFYKDGEYFYRDLSVFHYLNELELDEICNDFNDINKNEKDWDSDINYGVSKKAGEFLTDCFEIEVKQNINTYNYESDLSQTLQYTFVDINCVEYVLLQIHNGADVRGGYTDAKLFKLPKYSEGMLNPNHSDYMEQSEIEFHYDNALTLN